jgi:hypothetical protein
MKYSTTIIILLIFFCSTGSKAQSNIDGVKITVENDVKSKSNNEIDHGKVEVFIKDKKTQKIIPVFYIRIGKVGVFVSNTDGYSKFFIKPGRYDVVVNMYGYNEKRIKKLKISSKNKYKIEIELEQKT